MYSVGYICIYLSNACPYMRLIWFVFCGVTFTNNRYQLKNQKRPLIYQLSESHWTKNCLESTQMQHMCIKWTHEPAHTCDMRIKVHVYLEFQLYIVVVFICFFEASTPHTDGTPDIYFISDIYTADMLIYSVHVWMYIVNIWVHSMCINTTHLIRSSLRMSRCTIIYIRTHAIASQCLQHRWENTIPVLRDGLQSFRVNDWL